ncbi:DNA primase [Paenibacillus phage vB_PlaP_API480]|uniref:DNA primase n=1 Tax=Paenibacillus larvae subsp. larvae TaxID=147375 RepID=A0A6C0R183_9BACL|nr:CHC2 zinc finger domain-containing protein [Paenibacillus larvae]QBX06338.1 DNA primase [Paenibacillus phage vB_PlaP_API480]QHZ54046.1 DNA primase [Paenibacillus larvae subsp. larvae]
MIFEQYFPNLEPNDKGEASVLCPFHSDHSPSAHVNLEKGTFHCKVCELGHSEVSFLAAVEGITYTAARKRMNQVQKRVQEHGFGYEKVQELHENLTNNEERYNVLIELGFNPSTIKALKLGYDPKDKYCTFVAPVLIGGMAMDFRRYRKNAEPKVLGDKNSKPLIFPYDIWDKDKRPTLLCAGEKDTVIARSRGFNAICFTGGEGSFPVLFGHRFNGRKVYIVYDNDKAGMDGAYSAAVKLKEAGSSPYVVTGHHYICKEKGEDIWDFFMKYKKTANDLKAILANTKEVTEAEYRKARVKSIPEVTLDQALTADYIGKTISTCVQVVATYDDYFQVPTVMEAVKYDEDSKFNTMCKGEKREWSLDLEERPEDILKLIDVKGSDVALEKNAKFLCGVPANEKFVSMKELAKDYAYKAVITDANSGSLNLDGNGSKIREIVVVTVGQSLESGKKYYIDYKIVANKAEGRRSYAIAQSVREHDSEVSNFVFNQEVKKAIAPFRVSEGQTIEEKIDEIFEKAKGFIGVEASKNIFLAVELFYHTPLMFNFAGRQEKSALDVMIIGEPRSMKSRTAKKLHEMYELGVITSLKTSTTAGLIGGSDKTAGGGYKTKIGIIPRNHKSAVILEEFSGADPSFISTITEVRSSNILRINRVNGTLEMDCMVRTLTISNPKAVPGHGYRPISSYTYGSEVIQELVPAPEDIARYDFFLLVARPKQIVDLRQETEEPYEKESYMSRVRAIWSRNPDQIILADGVEDYIQRCAEELTSIYSDFLNFFGTETWLKLSRISIATAAIVANYDDNGRLIVTADHVDFAMKWYKSCYDNELFRLREQVRSIRQYEELGPQDVNVLENIYKKFPAFVDYLEENSEIYTNEIKSIVATEQEDRDKLVNVMLATKFVRLRGNKLERTPRLMKALRKINKVSEYPKELAVF